MYRIIGGDQKEYGPIPVEQIRQWIKDGRLNAQTQARREDGGEWQPLSAFSEFADAFRPAMGAPAATPAGAPLSAGNSGSRDAALSAVKGPAISLIIIAGLGVAINLFYALMMFIGNGAAMYRNMSNLPPETQQMMEKIQGPLGGLIYLLGAAVYGAVLFGAIKMLKLQSRGLAMTACILAMLPCSCCCLLGLPFGIWGLVVLNKPEVKSHFES